MPNIDSITFETGNWQPIEKQPYKIVWGDDVKSLSAVLSLEFFSMPPDIPVAITDINGIRFIYRTLANQSGAGLISADVVEVAGIECVETIFKLPQDKRGMVYIGSLTVPFEQLSYVVKIQSVERGVTGIREAVILDKLVGEGFQFNIVDEKMMGWSADPYDPDGDYPLTPNLAEDEKYDAQFPDHALTKVRKTLSQIKRTMRLRDELKTLPVFTRPL